MSIELRAISRYRHNMTERLLNATLSPNQTKKQNKHICIGIFCHDFIVFDLLLEPYSYFSTKTFVVSTLQPLYNTVLDITQFKDGSQKCIYTFLFGYNTVV